MTNYREALEREYEQQLKQSGKAATTVGVYMSIIRRFLAFVGNEPLAKLDENVVREYFNQLGGSSQSKKNEGSVISQFMRFALVRLPVPAGKTGTQVPALDPVRDAREIALRQRWTLDRVVAEKERADDLIAALGRQLVNHYLFFQARAKGERENLDEVIRLMDECQQLIEMNLPLFLKLSALGKNLGPLINERTMR